MPVMIWRDAMNVKMIGGTARSLRRRNGRSQGIASKRMDCVI